MSGTELYNFLYSPNQSMFGFTVGFYLFSNLVSENILISHEVNSSKRDPKFYLTCAPPPKYFKIKHE
jgi:hypothetical protein